MIVYYNEDAKKVYDTLAEKIYEPLKEQLKRNLGNAGDLDSWLKRMVENNTDPDELPGPDYKPYKRVMTENE